MKQTHHLRMACQTTPVKRALYGRLLLCCLGLSVSAMAESTVPQSEKPAYRVAGSFLLPAPEPACKPSMTRVANGELIVVYSTQWEPWPAPGVLYILRSSDEGKTWSEPEILWKDSDPGVTLLSDNGLTTLQDGTILLAASWCKTPRKADVPDSDHGPEVAYEGEKRQAQVYVLSSSDHGKTWANPRPLPKPHWHPWIQHFGRVAELSNGDLLLPVYGKSSQRYAAYYRSRDHGVNWVGPTIFLSPARREMNLVQVPRGPVNFIGTLLAVIRNHGELGGQRREFAIAQSIDLGYTWRRPQLKGIQGKMPDLLVQNEQLLMVVGLEGLADGSEALKLSRSSYVTMFSSANNGQTWQREMVAETPKADQGSTYVAADSPVLAPLSEGKLLLVCQGVDFSKKDDPQFGWSAGFRLVANILEPTISSQ